MTAQDNRRSFVPILMISLGVLLIFGSITWLVYSTQASVDETPTLASSASTPRIPYPEIRRIRVGDAKAALDLGSAIFIDVRGEPYYAQGHIPGALSLTEADLEQDLSQLRPNDWIIIYCT
jgi:3-mercaptopyruvate sulfurtransferase SseA